jgi:hypothetical protein
MTDDQRERVLLALDRLDNFVAGLVNMTMLDDSIHVEALRGGLPEVAAELRAAIEATT